MFSEYMAKNGPALQRLIDGGAEVRTFPAEVLQVLEKYTDEIQAEHAEQDKFYARVYEQWTGFRDSVRTWTNASEYRYLRYVNGDLA